MDTQEFRDSLKADNFGEVVMLERPIGYAMGIHQHPFDACALITSGAFTLTVNGVSSTYSEGDIFRLPAGTPHSESAGPSGASYLTGRRHIAPA